MMISDSGLLFWATLFIYNNIQQKNLTKLITQKSLFTIDTLNGSKMTQISWFD